MFDAFLNPINSDGEPNMVALFIILATIALVLQLFDEGIIGNDPLNRRGDSTRVQPTERKEGVERKTK